MKSERGRRGQEGREERVAGRNETLFLSRSASLGEEGRARALARRGRERAEGGGTWSRFGEGKGKGPGKTPKQIRVPSLTDRKFVEVRPGDSASRLSRHRPLSHWPTDCSAIPRDIHDCCCRAGEQAGRGDKAGMFFWARFGSIFGLPFRHRPITAGLQRNTRTWELSRPETSRSIRVQRACGVDLFISTLVPVYP